MYIIFYPKCKKCKYYFFSFVWILYWDELFLDFWNEFLKVGTVSHRNSRVKRVVLTFAIRAFIVYQVGHKLYESELVLNKLNSFPSRALFPQFRWWDFLNIFGRFYSTKIVLSECQIKCEENFLMLQKHCQGKPAVKGFAFIRRDKNKSAFYLCNHQKYRTNHSWRFFSIVLWTFLSLAVPSLNSCCETVMWHFVSCHVICHEIIVKQSCDLQLIMWSLGYSHVTNHVL